MLSLTRDYQTKSWSTIHTEGGEGDGYGAGCGAGQVFINDTFPEKSDSTQSTINTNNGVSITYKWTKITNYQPIVTNNVTQHN